MEKLIITVGLTGSRITRQQTPYIPVTPQEIAQSGIESWRAGASVLHIHVRDPKTGRGTQDLSLFKEVLDISLSKKIPMRTAALVLGIGRVAEASRLRGIYP